jgi:hypothetical protein
MKNPFLVFEEFLSPLQCEEIIIGNNNTFPNYDKDNKVQPLFFGNKLAESRIIPQLDADVVPLMESYYNVDIKGIKQFVFEWYSTGYDGKNPPRCENSSYINGKWQRVNTADFAGVVFLNDYNDKSPFDDEFEVMGGQLEFINHRFSFNPQRGTLIIFPGAPNFINNTAAVRAGELTQIRFHIATHDPFVYNMNDFKGDYAKWFNKGA